MVLNKAVIAKKFLILSHFPTLGLLIVLELIWWDHETFYHITLLMLLAGIANAVLKLLFKIPLPLTLGRCGFLATVVTFNCYDCHLDQAPFWQVLCKRPT